MSDSLSADLNVMWEGRNGDNIDGVIEAFERIEAYARPEDLPEIREVLDRPEVGFWIRELLMQIVVSRGGPETLVEAFVALRVNEAEGYDSDGLVGFLMHYAAANPEACKATLNRLCGEPASAFSEDAEWLLDHCEDSCED